MILISEKEKFFDPRKPFQSARPEAHEEWQARMGGEVLAVVRSGLYLDFRFLDQALSALTPTADERCGVLATDGTILCYQPSALLRLYQKNPAVSPHRLPLHLPPPLAAGQAGREAVEPRLRHRSGKRHRRPWPQERPAPPDVGAPARL